MRNQLKSVGGSHGFRNIFRDAILCGGERDIRLEKKEILKDSMRMNRERIGVGPLPSLCPAVGHDGYMLGGNTVYPNGIEID